MAISLDATVSAMREAMRETIRRYSLSNPNALDEEITKLFLVAAECDEEVEKECVNWFVWKYLPAVCYGPAERSCGVALRVRTCASSASTL